MEPKSFKIDARLRFPATRKPHPESMPFRGSQRTVLILMAALIVLAFPAQYAALAAEAEAGIVHPFKLKLESFMTVVVQGTWQRVAANTEIQYRWHVKDQERTLTLDSIRLQAFQDGKEILHTYMSLRKTLSVSQGKTNEVTFETAPEPMRLMLQETYGAPLCTLKVDNQGGEISRKITAGPRAQSAIDSGMIANALLFHPPFGETSEKWTTDAAVSVGNGALAKGKFEYAKEAGGKPLQKCTVAGTLDNDSFRQAGTPITVRDSHYVVTGTQTYDSNIKEWVSGKLTLEVSNKMAVNKNVIGSSKGTIIATLERLQ